MYDTTPEALDVQAEVHRKLGGPRKILIASQMTDSVRNIARARIRAQHPTFDEAKVVEQLVWELYGFRRER